MNTELGSNFTNATGEMLDLACPFLGLEDDPATRLGFPHQDNLCHRTKPSSPVMFTHQETTCLTLEHRNCKLYSQNWNGTLPTDILSNTPRRMLNRRWIGAILLAGLGVLLILAMQFGWFSSIGPRALAPSPSSMTSQDTLTPEDLSSVLPSLAPNTATATPVPATTTTQPTSTASPLPTATSSSTPAPPTPGPEMKTPFGPDNSYLLYTVQTGESISSIARSYDTSLEVIREMNLIPEGASIWPGTVLVIMPGNKDASQAPKFHIIQLDKPTLLNELAQAYNVSPEEIRKVNSLGTEDSLPAGRWLIIPAR